MQQKQTFGGLASIFTAIGAIGAGYMAGRFHMLSQAKKASPELANNGDVSVLGVVSKKKKKEAKVETETSNA